MLLALIAGAAAIPSPSQLHRWWTECAQTHPVACIRYAAAKYAEPFEEMRTVAWRESRLDPTVTSSAGCEGLFQFSRSTWRGVTVHGRYIANPYAPHSEFSARYSSLSAAWTWSHGEAGLWSTWP